MDDTKPLWKVGKAIVAFAGVSVAHISGDKALVLCQEGSPRIPRACSSPRRRGSPFVVGRVAALSNARHKLSKRRAGHRASRGRDDEGAQHPSGTASNPYSVLHCTTR